MATSTVLPPITIRVPSALMTLTSKMVMPLMTALEAVTAALAPPPAEDLETGVQ
jgi:hypothetical protein